MLSVRQTAIAKRGGVKPLDPRRRSLVLLRKRLARALADFLRAQAPKVAGQVLVLRSTVRKAAPITPDEQDAIDQIIAGIDFNGWAVVVVDVQPIIDDITRDGSYAALEQVGIDAGASPEAFDVVNGEAISYAEERAAEMVGMRRDALGNLVENPNAEWRIDETTREFLRGIVTEAIQTGQSNAELAQAIEGSYAFDETRAAMIARTETNLASNAGALAGYKASGVVDGKQWLTAEDDLVSEECEENGNAGPNGDGVLMDLDAEYPSGDVAPPVHPNCRCALAPYIAINETE